MKVITIKSWEKYNAGPKALEDVEKILEKEYKAKKCVIDLKKGKIHSKLKLAKNLFSSRFSKEILVIQYPVFERKCLLNLANKKRTIIFIHDIEGLRSQDKKLLEQEISKLKLFEYIVVHNKVMKELLISKGIKAEKLYVLELFDYLCTEEEKKPKKKSTLMEEKLALCYAGNLRLEKSPFIYQITDETLPFPFYVYGVGADTEKLSSKIHYEGKVSPEDLPNQMKGSLGIVWDGKWDEEDETEYFKQYTKYNNPHKLSCYLAAGIPVIVWEKAAIAEMVKRENLGYTIRSLEGIKNLNFQEYSVKKESAEKYKQKVRSGYYTKRVIEEIKHKMEEKK